MLPRLPITIRPTLIVRIVVEAFKQFKLVYRFVGHLDETTHFAQQVVFGFHIVYAFCV
jgi:hypothetical protein